MTRGFVFRASALHMRSTARYIGVMDLNGQILERNVLLRNADLDTGANVPPDFALSLAGPTMLGFRQLPLERWKTTPLYYAYLTNPARLSHASQPLETPLAVTVGRRNPNLEADESAHEDFRIEEVVDARGSPCRGEVALRLQTMPLDQETEGGYWLDTGILRTTGLKAS